MTFPVSANLVDNVTVTVHLHSFFLGDRDRYCWTYITRGLQAQDQREMCLSLIVDDNADTAAFPKTPIKMFQLLADRTSGDRKMRPGDATLLGQRGIFGFPNLFFVPAIQFETLPALNDHLALILVHQEEYDYARQHGLTRLLSRLGKFCSSFPYPTWNTQVRPSLFTESIRELSLLENASHLQVNRSYVHQQGAILTIAVHPDDLQTFQQALGDKGDDQAQIICTAFSPNCDASLYWQEGQEEVGAYAADTQQVDVIGGSFLSLTTGETSAFTIIEDGFELTLTHQHFDELKHAIDTELASEIKAADRQSVHVQFLPHYYSVDARPYAPRATWRKLSVSQPPKRPAGRRVALGQVSNLLGNNALEDNVSKPELQAYLKQLEQAMSDALSEEKMSFHFHLDVLIDAGEVEPSVESDTSLNPAFVEFIETLARRIPPCEVLSPIHLRLPFQING